MNNSELRLFRILFLGAAFWKLIGAVFAYFNPAYTFHNFFGRELTDPLFYAIYQGAWGTTLLYFIGYLIVAYNPAKHPGIVILGGIGKAAFDVKLLLLYSAGLANMIVFIVVIGDFLFVALFLFIFIFIFIDCVNRISALYSWLFNARPPDDIRLTTFNWKQTEPLLTKPS